MPVYQLEGAYRNSEGRIGPALLRETIEAESQDEAIRLVSAWDYLGNNEVMNALWLFDCKGYCFWTSGPPRGYTMVSQS